jgi:hypothetical protein
MVKWLLISTELLLDPIEIEGIPNELIINLAEELVVFKVAEPLNPASVLFRAVVRFGRHYSNYNTQLE